MDADDGAYLRIDGELVLDSRGVFGPPLDAGERTLTAGFRRLEIGHYQTHGEARLAIAWSAPVAAADASPLPAENLYAGRPLAARRTLRRLLTGWGMPYRRALGLALLIGGVSALARTTSRRLSREPGRIRRLWARSHRHRETLFLAALAAGTFGAAYRYMGGVRGGDDAAYLSAATFAKQAWFFGRYAHVYLLKLFVSLTGDPFAGARLWWALVATVTVVCLAVAARSLGRGLQLGTLAVTLFVLFSQGAVIGFGGAPFADYSAMMFVTAAVAVFLHGLAADRRRVGVLPPRHEWHALALGALTLGAFRSKEVGAVVVLLPLLYLLAGKRLGDCGRFARRMVYWTLGLVAAQALLVLLDGLILGNFLFEFEPARFARARQMNFPGAVRPRAPGQDWFQVVWSEYRHPASLSLRYLWVAVGLSAMTAAIRRLPPALRLVRLLPIAYLLALVVLYIRLPHPFSARMLVPVLPVAALVAALLARDAGLDEIRWRDLLAPAPLLVAVPVLAAIAFVVIPYRMGTLGAAEFLPARLVTRYGWDLDGFVSGVLLPVALLAAVALVALTGTSQRNRLAALLVAYLAVFGLGAEYNRTTLTKSLALQQGDLLRYPWEVFRDRLEELRPATVALSSDLLGRYRMTAATENELAALALGRRDLFVWLTGQLPRDAEVAIASRHVYREWRREEPRLAETAEFDPAGLLVLMRPAAALAGPPAAPAGGPGL